MKKLMVVAVLVALALPVAAHAGIDATAGKYTGTAVVSADPSLNGKPLTAEVKKEGTNNVATITYPDGAKEVWKWNAKTLDQAELDKAGKEGQKYGATFTGNGYYVNCKDKAKNICDSDIDSRNYWIIDTTPDSFKYVVFGVSKDKKADATAKAEKRHEFAFKLAK